MPGGFTGGALGFLCFGLATEVVAVAAARGTTYFFGGMAAGWEASGRENGGRKEEYGREVGKTREETAERGARLADRADPRALFACAGAPGAPRASGSAWVCQHQIRPEPAKNGLLGGDWVIFSAPARQKRLGRACWGRGWRCS